MQNILLYLLTLRYVLKFDNLHMTQCAKIIVAFVAKVGNSLELTPIWHSRLFLYSYLSSPS